MSLLFLALPPMIVLFLERPIFLSSMNPSSMVPSSTIPWSTPTKFVILASIFGTIHSIMNGDSAYRFLTLPFLCSWRGPSSYSHLAFQLHMNWKTATTSTWHHDDLGSPPQFNCKPFKHNMNTSQRGKLIPLLMWLSCALSILVWFSSKSFYHNAQPEWFNKQKPQSMMIYQQEEPLFLMRDTPRYQQTPLLNVLALAPFVHRQPFASLTKEAFDQPFSLLAADTEQIASSPPSDLQQRLLQTPYGRKPKHCADMWLPRSTLTSLVLHKPIHCYVLTTKQLEILYQSSSATLEPLITWPLMVPQFKLGTRQHSWTLCGNMR